MYFLAFFFLCVFVLFGYLLIRCSTSFSRCYTQVDWVGRGERNAVLASGQLLEQGLG
jgi:hypothetical protein